MKTLLLMRHAKSSWDSAGRTDHDRPLNDRGKRDAPEMGRWIAGQGLTPDTIITSSARRARKTAAKVGKALGFSGEIEERDDLYLASVGAWLNLFHSLPDAAACVLCVGHNPTLEGLVERLGGTRQAMPTAAVAHFLIESESWSSFEPGGPQVSLKAVWRPKEIDD